MRVLLFVPWIGPLPEWTADFLERVNDGFNNDEDDVEFRFDIVAQSDQMRFANIFAGRLGLDVPLEISGRKLCDYRPAFGHVFAEEWIGADWWGWCDLDVVFGKASSFLTLDRLQSYDLITDSPRNVNGPFTIMRNDLRMRLLYQRSRTYRDVFVSPEHVAFDEIGFTEVVQEAKDVRSLFLDNVHTHDNEEPAPILGEDGKLRSGLNGRELFAYHFPRRGRNKKWPL